ncbi:hypothetical protein [Nocardia sp. NPDC020380]|uniref:hypothetical protein n=1 Tax=Nocardia sp. NPDC020380 TaxID=3364309 RepID=UPI00379DFF94
MTARNLTLATAAFALTFWTWNLIGPLSSTYTKMMGLSPGGLGGYFPPLVVGITYGQLGIYTLGYLLLACTVVGAH